jgi:hypothetical protein
MKTLNFVFVLLCSSQSQRIVTGSHTQLQKWFGDLYEWTLPPVITLKFHLSNFSRLFQNLQIFLVLTEEKKVVSGKYLVSVFYTKY